MTDAVSKPSRPTLAFASVLSRVAEWRYDPLVHFLCIGAVLYLFSLAFSPRDDRYAMTIDDDVYRYIITVYAEVNGKAPTPEKMSELVNRWIIDETIYREALARNLEAGDEMIRERINQKMRVLIQSAVVAPEPEADELQTFFEANRSDYNTPAVISLQLARVDGDETEARRAAQVLNTDPNADDWQIVALDDRPRPSLVNVIGEPLVAAIEVLPEGVWSAVETVNGWQAVRLRQLTPGIERTFDEVRGEVRTDWDVQAFRKASKDAMEALIARYDIDVQPYDPDAFEEVARQAAQNAN